MEPLGKELHVDLVGRTGHGMAELPVQHLAADQFQLHALRRRVGRKGVAHTGRGVETARSFRSARTCSGVVPQQPPRKWTPASRRGTACVANWSGGVL